MLGFFCIQRKLIGLFATRRSYRSLENIVRYTFVHAYWVNFVNTGLVTYARKGRSWKK